MEDTIESLNELLSSLVGDSVVASRNAADKIVGLLNSTTIVSLLANESGQGTDWRDVIMAFTGFVEKCMRRAKKGDKEPKRQTAASPGPTLITNSARLRTIIKKADERGGYNLSSSVGELSAMLLHIASDKELRDGVSPEVLAVVDGDVAQVFATSIIRGKYITDLPTQTYLKIIKLAAQQMTSAPSVYFARLLEESLRNCPYDIMGLVRKIIPVFAQFFENQRDGDRAMQAAMVNAACHVVSTWGVNDSEITMDIFKGMNKNVLSKLSSTRATDLQLRAAVVQYFRVQFRVLLAPTGGKLTCYELIPLFEVVAQTLDNGKFNLASSAGKKNPSTGDRDHRIDYAEWSFFDMAADVFSHVHEHSTLSTGSESKRRKVADANIFERFFNGIFDSTDFQVQLHWTIALTAFAWKHPSAFTVEGVVQIVNDMAMQSERMRPEGDSLPWVMDMFGALADACKLGLISSGQSTNVPPQVHRAWSRAWEAIVMKISSVQGTIATRGLAAMRKILNLQLVSDTEISTLQTNVWRLITFTNLTTSIQSALLFLTDFMRLHKLKEEKSDVWKNTTRRERFTGWALRCVKDVYLFPRDRGYWEEPMLEQCFADCLNQLSGAAVPTYSLTLTSISDFCTLDAAAAAHERLLSDTQKSRLMYADLLDRSTLSGTVQKIPLQETQDSALSHRINSELFNLVDALTDVDFNTRSQPEQLSFVSKLRKVLRMLLQVGVAAFQGADDMNESQKEIAQPILEATEKTIAFFRINLPTTNITDHSAVLLSDTLTDVVSMLDVLPVDFELRRLLSPFIDMSQEYLVGLIKQPMSLSDSRAVRRTSDVTMNASSLSDTFDSFDDQFEAKKPEQEITTSGNSFEMVLIAAVGMLVKGASLASSFATCSKTIEHLVAKVVLPASCKLAVAQALSCITTPRLLHISAKLAYVLFNSPTSELSADQQADALAALRHVASQTKAVTIDAEPTMTPEYKRKIGQSGAQALDAASRLKHLSTSSKAELSSATLEFSSLVDDATSDKLVAAFLGLMAEPSIKVLQMVAQNIDILFKYFSEHGPLFADLFPRLKADPATATLERLSVALVALGNIASSSWICVAPIMDYFVDVCVPAKSRHDLAQCVAMVVSRMAKRLGQSVRNFTADHLPSLLHRWVTHKVIEDVPFLKFPISLAGASDFQQFIGLAEKEIIVELVGTGNRNGLEAVAGLVKRPVREWIISHIAYIFARLDPLRYVPQASQIYKPDVYQNVLQAYITVSDQDKLRSHHVAEIVGLLFAQFQSQDAMEVEGSVTPTLIGFNHATIERVLQDLRRMTSSKNIAGMLNIAPRSQVVLHELGFRIQSSQNPAEKDRLCEALTAFLKTIDDVIMSPQICFDVLLATLRLLQHPHRVEKNLQLLRQYLVRWLASAVTAPVVADLLVSLVGTLVALAEAQLAAPVALSLLEDLTVKASAKVMKEKVPALDPFPSSSMFAAFRKYHAATRGNYSLRQELDWFLERARSSVAPTSMLPSSLQHIKNKLHDNYTELYEIATSDDQSDQFRISKFVEGLRALAITSPGSASLIAECLGEIGPLDPSLRTLATINSSQQPSRGVVGILQYLYFVSVALDSTRAAVAFECLRGFLASSLGKSTLKETKELDSRAFEYLSKFEDNTLTAEKRQVKLAVAIDLDVWNCCDKSFESWSTELASTLATACCPDNAFACLVPLIKIDAAFGQLAFPAILENCISACPAALGQLISKQFFDAVDRCSSEAVQLIVQTLNYLHSQHIRATNSKWQDATQSGRTVPATSTTQPLWSYPFWNAVNFVGAAKAALRCSSVFSAQLFAELAVEKDPQLVASGATLKLLLDILANINDPDAVSGVEYDQSDMLTLAKTYMHEKEWHRAIGSLEVSLQQDFSADGMTSSTDFGGSPESMSAKIQAHQNLLQSMQALGQHHQMAFYLKGVAVDLPDLYPELSEFQYQAAWRSKQWNMVLDDIPTASFGFHKSALSSLRALVEGDASTLNYGVRAARQAVLQDLTRASLENTQSIQPVLEQLQMLSDICTTWPLMWTTPLSRVSSESALHSTMSFSTSNALSTAEHKRRATGRRASDIEVNNLLHRWETSPLLSRYTTQFEDIEPILAMRKILLSLVERPGVEEKYTHSYLRSARKSHRFEIASTVLYTMKKTTPAFSVTVSALRSQTEAAKLNWNNSEQSKAISAIHQVISEMERVTERRQSPAPLLKRPAGADAADSEVQVAFADALVLAGKWLAKTRSESSSTILKNYLQRASSLYSECNHANRVKGFFTVASFEDHILSSLDQRTKSAEWDSKRRLLEYYRTQRDKCDTLLQSATGAEREALSRHRIAMHKRFQQTEAELDPSTERNRHLELAVNNYILTLESGDKYDLTAVFRLISLWFSNPDVYAVSKLIQAHRYTLPPRKFLPLFYQMASRLSSTKSLFCELLKNIIVKVTLAHPHHTLYQLFALKNGKTVAPNQRNKNEFVVDDSKIEATNVVLAHIGSKMPDKARPLMDQMQVLVAAYIDFAFFDATDFKRAATDSEVSIPSNLSISRISQLDLTAVPTSNIPISNDEPFVHVAEVIPKFSLAGGINLPKIINVRGSDGRLYKQLVKGNDDMRQDAVMQQVFQLVNMLLAKSAETRQRNLRMRTYKVLPLAPCAGLLEWVNDTVPIGTYLVGRPDNHTVGAHFRYRPTDKPSVTCRKELAEATPDQKDLTYERICAQFRPVFHKFFIERFTEPSLWFQKRLAYTKSVAVSSMVGYIIGLGDRHAQNILLDKETAEVIHIDLGVAFEQGKTLKTPEIVPFRLTRDMVDGMGITGVKGVFTSCCEKTMALLREEQEALITIVEVFLHDPLFKWALSPFKVLTLQSEDDDVSGAPNVLKAQDNTKSLIGNPDAASTVVRLRQKLQGLEFGDALSITGQVKQLIAEAQDASHLSRMFPGWAPWI